MRKDVLAAGAAKAAFAGGMGESDITRNIMSDEDSAALDAQTAEAIVEDTKPKPRKVFRPLGEILLVRRAEVEETSGLIIDLAEKDKPAEGEVLAVGTDVKTVAVGDNVVFGKYAGAEKKLNGEVVLLMELKEIMGILEEEKTKLSFDAKAVMTTVGAA